MDDMCCVIVASVVMILWLVGGVLHLATWRSHTCSKNETSADYDPTIYVNTRVQFKADVILQPDKAIRKFSDRVRYLEIAFEDLLNHSQLRDKKCKISAATKVKQRVYNIASLNEANLVLRLIELGLNDLFKEKVVYLDITCLPE